MSEHVNAWTYTSGPLLPTAGRGGKAGTPGAGILPGAGARAGALGSGEGVPPAARCWQGAGRHSPAQGNFAALEKTGPSSGTFCQVGRAAAAMSRGVQGTLNPCFSLCPWRLTALGSALVPASGRVTAGGEEAGRERWAENAAGFPSVSFQNAPWDMGCHPCRGLLIPRQVLVWNLPVPPRTGKDAQRHCLRETTHASGVLGPVPHQNKHLFMNCPLRLPQSFLLEPSPTQAVVCSGSAVPDSVPHGL